MTARRASRRTNNNAAGWVVFDVNGTLLDPSAIDEALGTASGFAIAALDEAIAQSMTDALAHEYRPFSLYMQAALKRRLTLLGGASGSLDAGLAVARRMPPFDDASPALATLRSHGFRIAALTNSASGDAEHALKQAGLMSHFEELTGSDEVETYKPAAAMYERALAKQGASPAETWMVTAHGWDLLGAMAVGLKTAWVSRKERVLLETVPRPSVSGATLLEVAERIVAGTA